MITVHKNITFKPKEILLVCPVCETQKYLELSEILTLKGRGGLISVSIEKGVICNHNFLNYIDRNYILRDSYEIDYVVKFNSLELQILPRNYFKIEKKCELPEPSKFSTILFLKNTFKLISFNISKFIKNIVKLLNRKLMKILN